MVALCQNQAMPLVDEVRMDRSIISVVATETPSDAFGYVRNTVDMDIWIASDPVLRAHCRL